MTPFNSTFYYFNRSKDSRACDLYVIGTLKFFMTTSMKEKTGTIKRVGLTSGKQLNAP